MRAEISLDDGIVPSVLLARRLHDTIAQRLTGLSCFLGEAGPAPDGAVERCRDELRAAIDELSDALASVANPSSVQPEDVDAQVYALYASFPGLHLDWVGTDSVEIQECPLIESFLTEALRNVRKHARPTKVVIAADIVDDAMIITVVNDGVHPRRGAGTSLGSRLLALEAAAQGALADSRADRPGCWRQRLIVPSPQAALVTAA